MLSTFWSLVVLLLPLPAMATTSGLVRTCTTYDSAHLNATQTPPHCRLEMPRGYTLVASTCGTLVEGASFAGDTQMFLRENSPAKADGLAVQSNDNVYPVVPSCQRASYLRFTASQDSVLYLVGGCAQEPCSGTLRYTLTADSACANTNDGCLPCLMNPDCGWCDKSSTCTEKSMMCTNNSTWPSTSLGACKGYDLESNHTVGMESDDTKTSVIDTTPRVMSILTWILGGVMLYPALRHSRSLRDRFPVVPEMPTERLGENQWQPILFALGLLGAMFHSVLALAFDMWSYLPNAPTGMPDAIGIFSIHSLDHDTRRLSYNDICPYHKSGGSNACALLQLCSTLVLVSNLAAQLLILAIMWFAVKANTGSCCRAMTTRATYPHIVRDLLSFAICSLTMSLLWWGSSSHLLLRDILSPTITLNVSFILALISLFCLFLSFVALHCHFRVLSFHFRGPLRGGLQGPSHV